MFYQHELSVSNQQHDENQQLSKENQQMCQRNDVNKQDTSSSSTTLSGHAQSFRRTAHMSDVISSERKPSSNSTPDCSRLPHQSIRSPFSDAAVQHGYRSTSQEELSHARDSRIRCSSASLETHGVTHACSGTLEHDVECDGRSVHASDPPLESPVDENITNRGDRITGRDVGSCSSGHRGEEEQGASTSHADQEGENGSKEQAKDSDPRLIQVLDRDKSELRADSRQSQSCPTAFRTYESFQSKNISGETVTASQSDHLHGRGRTRPEPTVLLWSPSCELHLQAEGSELWQAIPPMPPDSGIQCSMPLLHVARAAEASAVRNDVASSNKSKQDWNGIWETLGEEAKIQPTAQEEDIKEALVQQFKQRRNGGPSRSCRIEHKPWTFMSTCVESARHKSPPGAKDLQTVWIPADSCVQDGRGHSHQGRPEQDEVSARNSYSRVHSIPKGVRKRIIGEVKKQIQHLEQPPSECEEYAPKDVGDAELRELFHLMKIGEVYSPPRCTARARQHGLKGGRAFDLTLGDNLLNPACRKACLKHLREQDYGFLAVTPPCTMFSSLQFLGMNRSKEELENDPAYQQKFRDAMVLLTFGIICCLDQQRRGKWYMFEQPWNACSWRQPIVQRVLKLPNTYVGRTDQCCFGLVDANHAPIRKRTGIMSNSRCLIREVVRTCKGNHIHQHCVGSASGQMRSTAAAKYTNCFVDAILRGITKEMTNQAPRNSQSIEEYQFCMYQLQQSSDESAILKPQVFLITSPDETGTVPQVQRYHLDVNASPLNAFPGEVMPASAESEEHLAPDDEEVGEINAERRQRIMNEIRAIHQGLGHPCLSHLLKILRAGKASKAVCQIAKEFRCATCEESARPKPWRRAAPPRDIPFNEVVGVDLLTVKHGEFSVQCLNIIDWGTRYQMVLPLSGATSHDVRTAYRTWTTCFGAPRVVKCDLGREFQKEFSARCSTDGSILEPTSLEAPTQNAITEREGKSFKMIFYKAAHEHGTMDTRDEVVEMIHMTALMKNRLSHRGGYSPIHRVFGITPCLPGEIMRGGDGHYAHTAAIQAGDVSLQKQESMRLAAGRAFFSHSCTEAIRRAKYSGSRRVDQFEVGDVVYFWAVNQHMKVGHRNSASRKPVQLCWNGPATVVAYQHPSSLYLNHQGRLVKAAPEQCRHSSETEEISTHALLEKLCRVRQNLQKDQVTGIEDITGLERPDHVEDHPTHMKRFTGKKAPPAKRLCRAAPSAAAEIAEPSRTVDLDQTDDEHSIQDTISLNSDIDDDDDVRMVDDDSMYEPSIGESMWTLNKPIGKVNCWMNKTQSKELKLNELDSHDQQLFREAIKKEWNTNINAGAIRVIPPHEAVKVRQTMQHRIMKSRLLHVAKPIDDMSQFDANQVLHWGSEEQHCKAKSRWIVRGDKDPDLFNVESTSPVVSRDSMFLGLQVITSHQWQLHFADFSQAFMQGDTIDRQEPLFCEIPCDQIDGVEPGSLVQIMKTVYGLTDAPYQWNRHLDGALQSLGYRPSILDACLYMLQENGVLHGVIMLATDDLISGGDEQHWKRMEQLKQQYKFGKWEYNKGRFCGKDIVRNKDSSVSISQEYYTELKCKSRIHIPKGFEDDQLCTPDQVRELRSHVGTLSWLAKETRVDIAGSVALLMQCFPNPRIKDLKTCNKILKDALKHKDILIHLQPIDPQRLSVLVTSDAAWGNAVDEKGNMEKSQAGFIVMACDREILQGKESGFSILGWKSHTLKRRTVSTLGAETQAIVESSAVASWYRYILMELMHPKQIPRLNPNWEDSLKTIEFGLVTDAKSVFDALSRPSAISASDKRTCIDLSIIREFLRQNNGCIRWIDGKYQLADSLTKLMPADFLRSIMKIGRYQLTDECSMLQTRKNAKEMAKQTNKNS